MTIIYFLCQINKCNNLRLFITDLPHPYNKIGDGPEGPEARTVADKLRQTLVNRSIINGIKGERGKSIGFDNLKCPATIIGVRSYGKKVLIDLDSDHVIVISLGMGGRLQYMAGDHSHIHFEIGEYQLEGPFRVLRKVFTLYFDDHRYMGSVDIIPTTGIPLYFNAIGPDLLEAALDPITWISLEKWLNIFCQKKLKNRVICNVLMEQSLVAGIGNYLSAEVLYYAGIHPERIVSTMTIEEWDRIRIAAHKVILSSYSYSGFTIESFISPDGSWGQYPAAVYGKTHDPLGNPVVKKKIKGRTSHWVPAIQH